MDSSLFVLPLDAPVTLDDVGFMSFKKREATALGLATTEVKSDFRFDMGLKVHVTPAITARIILDETVGDILEGQGQGELSIDYPNSGDLQMNGMLTLNKGTYLFTLENLINKPFTVEPGANLTWSGDPYHAQVDLTAVYKTRTNPGPYLGLSSQERLPVDVKLHVTDDLMQPNLGFDIALPTAGSATQAALQSRLVSADEKTTQSLESVDVALFLGPATGLVDDGSFCGGNQYHSSTRPAVLKFHVARAWQQLGRAVGLLQQCADAATPNGCQYWSKFYGRSAENSNRVRYSRGCSSDVLRARRCDADLPLVRRWSLVSAGVFGPKFRHGLYRSTCGSKTRPWCPVAIKWIQLESALAAIAFEKSALKRLIGLNVQSIALNPHALHRMVGEQCDVLYTEMA